MAVYVRARDVRNAVKELGYERGVVSILERMCEERAGERDMLRQMSELVNQCIDQVAQMVQVGQGMQVKMKDLERANEQYTTLDHIPPSN